jgi:hypothetical protein
MQLWKVAIIKRLHDSTFNKFDQLRIDGYVPDDALCEFLGKLEKLNLIFFTGEFNIATTKRGNKIFALFLWLVKMKLHLRRADMK